MTKEKFDFWKNSGLPIKATEEENIERLINILIEALYIPVESDLINVRDIKRCEFFEVDDEPINWGDLKCVDVKKFEDGTFLATIDEAAPDDCTTFCQYIERHLLSYGWQVKVQTEW